MDLPHLILAVLPFTLFGLLLVFHQSASLLKVSVITLITTIVVAILNWHSSFETILFSGARGFFVATDIFFIIFGAILFLEVLNKRKIVESLAVHLDNFSSDIRVQVIMLAWFLEGFLEGIAGFGTPSIVVAPMLVALGVTPFKAIIISLLGNSISVPFGAVGTPLRVGFAGIDINLTSVGSQSAIYSFVGALVPVFMLWVLVSSRANKKTLFFQALPFALWSGVAFVVPSYLVSLMGIEFPSILGAILGMVLVILTSKFGLFIPKSIYSHTLETKKSLGSLSLKKVVFPYGLFILLLLFLKILLSKASIPLPFLSYSINLFNPGFVFVITTVIVSIFFGVSQKDVDKMALVAFKKSVGPFLVIAAMSTVVQLMNSTGNSNLGLLSMTKTISLLFNTKLLPVLAPFIGALGSFMTGSATVSNLMFASPVNNASLVLNLDQVKVLALLLAGAGAGNMVAIADILAAKTVVDSKESLRKTILAILPYCLVIITLMSVFSLVY